MSDQFETPILFLIFNRPETTQQVFNQIRKVKPKYLYVAADGPRLKNNQDIERCEQTRNIINQIDWDCEVKTLFRDENLGCRKAVSFAITWFFNKVEQGIILEDDCLPDLSFFKFCEELLIKYKNDTRVFQISGNNFTKIEDENEESYYFSRYPLIWGWATWKRAWEKYDLMMKDFNVFDKKNTIRSILSTKVEQKRLLKSFKRMFIEPYDTWDNQWLYTVMKNNGVAIVPKKNIVINIGIENNSTHTFLYDSIRSQSNIQQISFPLRHPPFMIDTNRDNITFNNIWSKGFKRVLRLIRENGFIKVVKYIITR
ncbi:nucleotide-diphospho-sugar transferase [Candidatus Dojkabacteria bacterium]|nr:nucleotide-diphospho-sugar transferase [Candidatus Dojkabacteria bacterium]